MNNINFTLILIINIFNLFYCLECLFFLYNISINTMIILEVPKEFQPNYISTYPQYSAGKNMEEIFFNYLSSNKDKINTEYIYIPIFWTSYYILKNYGQNISSLIHWLEKLDTSKKYFTIVQYSAGIMVSKELFYLPIKVFSAGGGGINVLSDSVSSYTFFNMKRDLFNGARSDHVLPLICYPEFPNLNLNKNIYCSFMGRLDTHPCRCFMYKLLKNEKNFLFFKSLGYNKYKDLINNSIFTLCPRGYGYTSFRLFEAILAISIPIYIWENEITLPYQELLDYNEFCVIVHSSKIKNIPSILKKINIDSFQKKLKQIRNCFTYQKMFDYVKYTISLPKKISVAIPHYNNTKFITSAIKPLINDDRIDEIVICDDNSSDKKYLIKIINDFKSSKIKLQFNNTNLGCYHNKIKTVSYCKNDWTILLDSDNIIQKNYIDQLFNIKDWDNSVIYCPEISKTFPGEQSPFLIYSEFKDTTIDLNYAFENKNNQNFKVLTNTCNYFLPVKRFLQVMDPLKNNFNRDTMDCLDSAIIFKDWLISGNTFFVVNKLFYHHRLHPNSNFTLSKSKKFENTTINNIYVEIQNAISRKKL